MLIGQVATIDVEMQLARTTVNVESVANTVDTSNSDVSGDVSPTEVSKIPQQFGGTIGGPILKDKLFFFFSYEGERQPLTSIDSPTAYLNAAGQQITFSFPNSYNTRACLLHMDWQISSRQHLSVTGSGSTWAIPFDGVAGTVSPQGEYAATRTFHAVAGTWSYTLTPALVNELKIGFNHYNWANTPLLQTQAFQALDGNRWGAPYNYPQVLGQNNTQFRDDLFWLKGNNSFKFGADYQHLPYSGNFGQYVRGVVTGFNAGAASVPLINVFPVWNQPSTWNVALLDRYVTTFIQGFGSYIYSIPTNNLGAWMQDDWKATKKLTLNLGLRYDNDLGIFNPDLHLTGPGAPPTPHWPVLTENRHRRRPLPGHSPNGLHRPKDSPFACETWSPSRNNASRRNFSSTAPEARQSPEPELSWAKRLSRPSDCCLRRQ